MSVEKNVETKTETTFKPEPRKYGLDQYTRYPQVRIEVKEEPRTKTRVYVVCPAVAGTRGTESRLQLRDLDDLHELALIAAEAHAELAGS